MTRINLLPWREELKKQRKIQFGIMLGVAAALGLLTWGIGHWHYQGLIDHQKFRNRVLENEIKLLDQRIAKIRTLEETKARLVSRMNIIQELQQGRPQIVHLFHQLTTTLPDGVYVTAVKQTGSSVSINGIAESNARIASFMERLDRSDWLADPSLDVIQVREERGRRLSQYTLKVRQTAGPMAEAAPAPKKAPAKKAGTKRARGKRSR